MVCYTCQETQGGGVDHLFPALVKQHFKVTRRGFLGWVKYWIKVSKWSSKYFAISEVKEQTQNLGVLGLNFIY